MSSLSQQLPNLLMMFGGLSTKPVLSFPTLVVSFPPTAPEETLFWTALLSPNGKPLSSSVLEGQRENKTEKSHTFLLPDPERGTLFADNINMWLLLIKELPFPADRPGLQVSVPEGFARV